MINDYMKGLFHINMALRLFFFDFFNQLILMVLSMRALIFPSREI